MSVYQTEQLATAEVEYVATRIHRAGFMLGALFMFAGLGSLLAAFTVNDGRQWGTWLTVGLLNFALAWWINAFSDAIAQIVKSTYRKG